MKSFYKHRIAHVLALVYLVCISPAIMAQGPLPKGLPDIPELQQANGPVIYSIDDDGNVFTQSIDPNDNIRIIVQLELPPLSQHMGKDKSPDETLRQQIMQQQEEFLSAFQEYLDAKNQDRAAYLEPAELQIHRQYQMVINGISLSTRQWALAELATLRGVKQLHIDRKATISLNESLAIIGAPNVWQNHGFTGEGIIVGIVDTGIDYMHPALGGGIGPGYKVIAGHSFIDYETSPLDMNGHGTHVAGIVAASGPLNGVAPGASLIAYKVIDQNGSGWTSWTIEAIEQAVEDQVHVLNMSLTAEGDANDILAQATDNASLAGVVCVVASGNSGPEYMTVQSPASARSAITVGASTKSNEIAWFSSRGPSKPDFGIKPELLAPGQDIYSCLPNASYGHNSGTSMASPMVAGGVALILQKYPGMSPSQVKSLLVHSSTDLGYDLLTQGGGLMNLSQAFQPVMVLVEPPLLSFGSVNTSLENWSSDRSFIISNTAAFAQNFSIQTPDDLPAASHLSFSQSSVSLAPGQSAELTATLTVNGTQIGQPAEGYFAFESGFEIVSQQASQHIPLVFGANPYLTLSFDEDPNWLYLFRRDDGWFFEMISCFGSEKTFMLPAPGYYDIVVFYHDHVSMIVMDNTHIGSDTQLYIEKSLAANQICLYMADENDEPILASSGITHLFTSRPQGGSWGNFAPYLGQDHFFQPRFFSDFGHYNWYWYGYKPLNQGLKNYVIGGGMNACSGSMPFHYEGHELKAYAFNFQNINPQQPIVAIPTVADLAFNPVPPDIAPLQPPYEQLYYMGPHYTIDALLGFEIRLYPSLGPGFEHNESQLLYKTAPISQKNGQLAMVREHYNPMNNWFFTDVSRYPGTHYPGWQTPPVFTARPYFSSGHFLLFRDLDYMFMNQMLDVTQSNRNYAYKLFANGQLVQQGRLIDDFGVQWPETYGGITGMGVPLNQPVVVELFSDDYMVQGQPGQAFVQILFQRTHASPIGYCPRITSLFIMEDQKATELLHSGHDNRIGFSLNMTSIPGQEYAGSYSLSVKHQQQDIWIELPTLADEEYREAIVPDILAEGHYDVRLKAAGNTGISIVYNMNPGFYKQGSTQLTVQSFTLSGEGSYCDGYNPSGMEATLSSSQEGMLYQLFKGELQHGPMITGNGQALSWTNLTAGTYTVSAYDGHQLHPMQGSASFTSLPSPSVWLSDFDIVLSDAEAFPLTGGTPEGGFYSGEGVDEMGWFHPMLTGRGVFDITYRVLGGNGCYGFATKPLQVIDPHEVSVPMVSVPEVSVYPNPARDQVNISFTWDGEATADIQLFSLQGQLITAKSFREKGIIDTRLSTHGMTPGVYLLRIVTPPYHQVKRLIINP